jgi:hypothetical protein
MKMPGFRAESSLYRTSARYRSAGTHGILVVDQGLLPQLRGRDDWTTDKVCTACGCTVSGFTCNCGMPPSRSKLECIRNGGPSRAVLVLGDFG